MYPVHWHAFVNHLSVGEYFHLKSVTKILNEASCPYNVEGALLQNWRQLLPAALNVSAVGF